MDLRKKHPSRSKANKVMTMNYYLRMMMMTTMFGIRTNITEVRATGTIYMYVDIRRIEITQSHEGKMITKVEFLYYIFITEYE
jgi:hypothetical protein